MGPQAYASGEGSVHPLPKAPGGPGPGGVADLTVPDHGVGGPGAFAIGREMVAPGERRELEIPVTCLPTGSWLSIPVTVVNGIRPGPRLFLTGALHGDELVGLEIVRSVLRSTRAEHLAGTLVAVPVVDVLGVLGDLRQGPDHRDLDRSFPGSSTGSTASQLAQTVTREIVSRTDLGIDFRSSSGSRACLAHICCDLGDPAARRLATAFGAPVTLHTRPREGSLRYAAARLGHRVLVFEGGEAGRVDAAPLQAGTAGALRVMEQLGMRATQTPAAVTREATETQWVRARRGGILRLEVGLGQTVQRGQDLGTIGDTRATSEKAVRAPVGGVVLEVQRHPVVHQGDAIVQIAITT